MNLQTVHHCAYVQVYLSFRMKLDQQPYYLDEVYVLYHHLMLLRNISCPVQYILSYMYLQLDAGNV